MFVAAATLVVSKTSGGFGTAYFTVMTAPLRVTDVGRTGSHAFPSMTTRA